jgi:HlyD family secretion protein
VGTAEILIALSSARFNEAETGACEMKTNPTIGIFFAVLVGGAAVYYFFSTAQPSGLIVEGVVDANQVVVAPKIQGLLERLTVAEGDAVRAGEVIAKLDTAELRAELEADRANVDNLRAQLAQSQSNYQLALNETAGDLASAQARLDMTKAQLAQSEAQLKRIEDDYRRTEALAGQGVSARQDLDHITADLRVQQATVLAQRELVHSAEGDLIHAKAGEYRQRAAKSAVESAQSQLQNAEAELTAAQARLDNTRVIAPISGIVSVLVARQGEVVGPGSPVVTIVDPRDSWVRVGIPETYADRIAVGETLQLQFPSQQLMEGTVLSKRVDGDFATQHDLSQQTREIRSVSIKISVPNPELKITPGMSAKVLITPEQLSHKMVPSERLTSR